MDGADQVLEAALRLEPEARARVVRALLASLDVESEDVDVEALWVAEVARRLDEVEAGHVQPEAWEQVRRRLHARKP